eukprot:209637-Alexandrium_andersonii.AAC.1
MCGRTSKAERESSPERARGGASKGPSVRPDTKPPAPSMHLPVWRQPNAIPEPKAPRDRHLQGLSDHSA